MRGKWLLKRFLGQNFYISTLWEVGVGRFWEAWLSIFFEQNSEKCSSSSSTGAAGPGNPLKVFSFCSDCWERVKNIVFFSIFIISLMSCSRKIHWCKTRIHLPNWSEPIAEYKHTVCSGIFFSGPRAPLGIPSHPSTCVKNPDYLYILIDHRRTTINEYLGLKSYLGLLKESKIMSIILCKFCSIEQLEIYMGRNASS